MCGICGAVGLTDLSTLDAMAECLSHRGPNSLGTHRDESVMLANQRLSIIDIDGGDQPIYNEDGDVVVVYNGEIYNYPSLRAELETAGHTFSTETDTEVLVHGYEEYGTGIFERLNGMFAVAVWDMTADRLLLARDRAGVKPLYYASVGDAVVFGSEPKSILKSGQIKPAIDESALQYFLQLRYSPPSTSLFKGIETLRPGTYLDVRRENGKWVHSTSQYWRPSPTSDPPGNPAKAVRETLKRAVDRQLMSEVPVGFYLSGGLDTSSVVAMASELTDEPIHTFCMGFDDEEWDERADARAVADHFGTVHHELSIDGDFMNDFPEMIWYADEPKRNLYPYYVAEKMSEHVTVALGGLGADELFGGYVYRYNRLHELEQRRAVESPSAKELLMNRATQLAELQREEGSLEDDRLLEEINVLKHIDDPETLYVLLNSTDVIGDHQFYEDRVFGENLQDEMPPSKKIQNDDPGEGKSLREKALYWDFRVKLPDDFLLVEDRMSMAHSLESRVPFLDNELINLAFRLSASKKFSGKEDPSVGKVVLQEAMRPVLPDPVFEKDKQGFTMPTLPFVRNELLDHARAILDSPYIVDRGLVSESYLRNLLARTPSKDLVHHYKLLWKLVALEIWCQMYIVGDLTGPERIESYYT